jgi:uncharacterized protein (TIGR00303 family)
MLESPDILKAFEPSKAESFLKEIEGKDPIFVCTIATTETAKIKGISAAGKDPEFTDYTPPADMEYLYYGRCRCIDGVPVTPDGIPTPALITKVAIDMSVIPVVIVDAGSKIKPQAPFLDIGGRPGMDIRTGQAVNNVSSIFERAMVAGRNLAGASDYLVLGESIPGGTTTALSVMIAIGLDAKGRVSSSMPDNPHNLKLSVVRQAIEAAGIGEGELKGRPLEAISMVGDPMQVAVAGLMVGAAKKVPVMLAGGTQMAAVLAVVNEIDPSLIDCMSIATTRWLIKDQSSDIVGLVSQVGDVPVMAANLDFKRSRHSGLQAYESGVVKEGVGAGGVTISSIAKTAGQITMKSLQEEIEREYERIVSSK